MWTDVVIDYIDVVIDHVARGENILGFKESLRGGRLVQAGGRRTLFGMT